MRSCARSPANLLMAILGNLDLARPDTPPDQGKYTNRCAGTEGIVQVSLQVGVSALRGGSDGLFEGIHGGTVLAAGSARRFVAQLGTVAVLGSS
jgi:hypothetical protein